MSDFIEDPALLKPEEEMEEILLSWQLRQALDPLPARQRRIIQLRFGLVDGSGWTLGKISNKLWITRERVRRIQSGALNILRDPA